MSGFTNKAENKLLRLLFRNEPWTNLGDGPGLLGSAADGGLQVSLHTASPGDSGDQDTNETTYTNYTRFSSNRTTSWAVTASASADIQVADNTLAFTFATASSSGDIITHVGIGTGPSGPGNLYAYAALVSPYTVTNGQAPEFAIGDLDWFAD
jgi:hypothetical protein